MRKNTIDMVHGPLIKNTLIFAIPIMLANLLQIAFNAADTIVIGKFSGQIALAAVGAAGPVVNLMVSLFNGLSIGVNIVIARLIGSKNRDKISKSVHTSYFLALAGGLILTIVGLFGSSFFLSMMGTPSDILDQSMLYMRIYFLGSIPLLIYDVGAAILRSKGDTTRPTIYLAISGVLNVILNLIFVICFKLGVAGVAIATVISQCVSASLVTKDLLQEKDEMKLIPHHIAMDQDLFILMMKIGIPAGLQSMMWSISNVAVQSAINTFGSVAIAGNSAAANIEGFVYIGMGAFAQSCITFTSQCAGANEKQKIKKVMWVNMALIVVSCFVVGAILCGFGSFFLSLYTNDPEVIQMGMIRMLYVVFFLWLNGVLDIPASSLRGMGYSSTPTIAMLLGIVGFRLAYIATIWEMFPTLEVLYLCFPLSWTITSIIMLGLWFAIYKRY